MPIYEYTGTAVDGTTSSGRRKASDPDALRRILLDKGILLQSAIRAYERSVKDNSSHSRSLPKGRKHLAGFTRQLVTLLKGGMPLETALQTLMRQSKSPAPRRVFETVTSDVRKGVELSDALSNQESFFGRHYVELVRAGEATGNLAQILTTLADYLEKSEKVRRKVRAAIAYPITVFVLSLIVVAIIVLYIVPTFSDLFTHLNVELPKSTSLIIAGSAIVRENAEIITFVVMLSTALAILLGNSRKGCSVVSSTALLIPGIKSLVIRATLANFSMTIATLLDGGVDLDEALGLSSESIGNERIRRIVQQGRNSVRGGGSLHDAWHQGAILPPLFKEMVSLGEETGSLGAAFSHLSDYFGNEVETTGTTVISMLEPVLILCVGLIVAGVLITMYLPLFDLVNSISL